MHTHSTLEFALVGLLQQQAQSGYDLRKTFANTAMRHYSDSPGSIYPALRRLEARGWIAVEVQQTGAEADRRGRTVYGLTAEGRTALVGWLERPVTRDDLIWRSPELMLRFAFMDGNVPRSTTLQFLEQFDMALGAYVAELRADFERDSFERPLDTGLLAFQVGIEGMEAQLDWARRTRDRLAEKER
ncbi:MAG TPA: PadR family transcriptional regulator [Terracidiphilus sp.]|nr:PadR family transcriptional regulator [Terracidiphilus sp.]